MVLEEQGKKLIIDPGEFTADFGPLDNVAAVVVTHEHGDHFLPEHLQRIVQANPDVVVFTTPEIVDQWKDPHGKAVHAYEDHQIGPFKLRFFGETHAEIHSDFPRPQNTGVLVNDSFYYPGDSFVEPDHDIAVLAIPVGAPWLKVGECMDFFAHTTPKIRGFRTHDALLSERGLGSTDAWLTKTAEAHHLTYAPLHIGESFEF